jgi:uncharacterized protein (TIGR03000 family)
MLSKRFSSVAVLALGVVLVAMDVSQAQVLRRGRRTRGDSDDAVITNPQPQTRQSNYVAPEGTDATRAAPASLDLRVPASAEVTFETEKTTQTGAVRSFESPPLTPGRDYVYEIKATWTENGREVVRTRQVNVRAGEQVMVDFTPRPASTARPASNERRTRSLGLLGRRRGS